MKIRAAMTCFVAAAAAFGTALFAQAPASLAPASGPTSAVVTPIPDRGEVGSPSLTKVDVDAWLDGLMPYALKRGGIPGAVVVVVKDGQPLTQRGFGYADVKTRRPVDPATTLFRPGSVSKLFTWTAVMQQVQQGKLDLDADVNTYLDFKIEPKGSKPITLRNLMTSHRWICGNRQILNLLRRGSPQAIRRAIGPMGAAADLRVRTNPCIFELWRSASRLHRRKGFR